MRFGRPCHQIYVNLTKENWFNNLWFVCLVHKNYKGHVCSVSRTDMCMSVPRQHIVSVRALPYACRFSTDWDTQSHVETRKWLGKDTMEIEFLAGSVKILLTSFRHIDPELKSLIQYIQRFIIILKITYVIHNVHHLKLLLIDHIG